MCLLASVRKGRVIVGEMTLAEPGATGFVAPAQCAEDERAIHAVTRGLSPTEVCRPAHLGSVASAGRWLAYRALPRTLSPDRSRSAGQPSSTRFRTEHAFRRLPIPANGLGPFELILRLRTPASAASTVRLLSGYCPANPNHCRFQTRFPRSEAVCHQVPTGTAERGHQGDQEGGLRLAEHTADL